MTRFQFRSHARTSNKRVSPNCTCNSNNNNEAAIGSSRSRSRATTKTTTTMTTFNTVTSVAAMATMTIRWGAVVVAAASSTTIPISSTIRLGKKLSSKNGVSFFVDDEFKKKFENNVSKFALCVSLFVLGNKQRQRERQSENFQVPSHGSNSKRRGSDLSRRISPSPHPAPLLDLKPSSQAAPMRHVEVTTTNINDLFNSSQALPPPIIVPESARRTHHHNHYTPHHSEYSQPHAPAHLPVKVHVAHKPTVEDITRVYNPYPIQVNAFSLKTTRTLIRISDLNFLNLINLAWVRDLKILILFVSLNFDRFRRNS